MTNEEDIMRTILLATIAGTLAATAAAQTGTVDIASVADHGTPAMHAAETARNVAVSRTIIGLTGTAARQQAVADVTRVADHGTPLQQALDASKAVDMSNGRPAVIATDKAAQDAVQQATRGSTR
jgi:hypothetical protein